MNKKVSLGAAVAFSAVVAAIVFSITMMFSQDLFNSLISSDSEREAMYSKIEKIDTIVDSNFLFAVDEEQVIDMIATGYIVGLDDNYATYLTKSEYEDKLMDDSGELVGIGVSISEHSSGYIEIVGITESSPAESAGLKVGDLIIQVGGEDVVTLGWDSSVDAIKGEEGTKVTLVVRRDSKDSEYEIPRKTLESVSVNYEMIDTNIYIQIIDFNAATVSQFKEALDFAKEQNATGIIFDVRNNGGGTMDSVCDMLDFLIPEGTIVTKTDSKGETTVVATSDSDEVDLPMVCITNSSSASASELFVSVLKDYGKAYSVGTTTYGKGVMQTTYALTDGSAVKITTAYFNPPISENFNGVGITPEYEVTLTQEQEENFAYLDETSDPQLMKAIEVVLSQTSSDNKDTTSDEEDTSSDEENTSSDEEDTTSDEEDTSSDEDESGASNDSYTEVEYFIINV